MNYFQTEDNSSVQNSDSKSGNDITIIKNNHFSHSADNKHWYIRDSVSLDSLSNFKGRGCCRMLLDIELQEVRSADFWRACFTEFIGTFLLCFYQIGIILFDSNDGEPPPLLHISIGHGLFVTAVVTALGETGGCHMNPAVTLAFASLRQVGITRTVFYIASQCAGAISGSMLLREVSQPFLTGNLGVISPGPNITTRQVACMEILITAFLLGVVVATSDKRRRDIQGLGPLVVGLTVVVNTLIANKVSGSCMNPARALGPAVVRGEFTNLWIYCVGPCCGALIGAHLYYWILAPVVLLESPRDYCVARRLDSKEDARPGIARLFSESLTETHL